MPSKKKVGNLLEYQLDEVFHHDSSSGRSRRTSANELQDLGNERDLVNPNTSDEDNHNINDLLSDITKQSFFRTFLTGLIKYSKYIGPGIMVSVSYMDPGNYSTNVAAGSGSKFTLLCVVLLSNLIAIFMQSLSVKLGTVTGMDFSRCCKKFLPGWLNLLVYVLAEVAIIATDLAEVIGSAIALNILLNIPLPAGAVLTIADVLIVMFFYSPTGSIRMVKLFEFMVACLVFTVLICFCVQLSYIPATTSVREIFRGYVPSKRLFQGSTMYDAIGILGATVMPHSIILGSGLVQPRLREFDLRNGYANLGDDEDPDSEESYMHWAPSYQSIKYSYKYSLIELGVSLFTFALFINSAILIVAGSTLYGTPEAQDADLYTIHDLLSKTIGKAAGTIFMISLLLSGLSSVFVVTITGQIVSEGHINWSFRPWIRRLITRLITIIPTTIISVSVGKQGLSEALNASQVILSCLLPFIIAPVIYFTSRAKIMKSNKNVEDYRDFSNNWVVTIVAGLLWIFIALMNVYGIVQAGKEGI